MNLGQTRDAVRNLLAEAKIPDADFEADCLICGATQISRVFLHSRPETGVERENFSKIMKLANSRAGGAPLSYVLGSAFFCGREFFVQSGVLIPRPETELLAEAASDILNRSPGGGGVFADWCAGSGCIGITLVLENPGWNCFAVDSSEKALAAARQNAESLGVLDRINFVCCQTPYESGIPQASLDLAVSNPPYIPTGVIASLERQVRDYEPKEALDGGSDGLDVYRTLLAGLPRLMKPEGVMIFETGGEEQADEVIELGARVLRRGKEIDRVRFVKKFQDHRGISRFVLWQLG
ncbi:MAG: peptide chain release factor N(5)-glutamine methyltransferase [Synergistaceae bacterium]|jgi:release factor glutamine methyltransferase|nr:peptide chain release factor N(5)-glutamine methyltransferase [Synergistaceae bacterium]